MPASEDRAISDFPIALQLLNTALVFASNPDGLGGYDSVHATLTEIGRVILETQYTQDLGNVDVFNAIKNCRVLSGTTNPTSAQGVDGQIYVKYQTVSNVDTVTGLYVKLNSAWVEIAAGGGGGGAYDATTAYAKDDLCIYNNVLYKALQATTGNLPTDTTYWEQTSIADEINDLNLEKADKTELPDTIVLSSTETVSISPTSTTVVNFTFNVPAGYTIVYAYDDSYRGNVSATLIRINSGSGSKVVHFNYIGLAGQSYTSITFTCKAVCMKNVTYQ